MSENDWSLEVQSSQLSILKDIAEALNDTTDVSEAMAAILPRLSEVLGLSTAWAFRYDPNRSSFVEVGASGLPPALANDDAAPLKCSWCECQDQFVSGKLNTAVNIVRCSRLRDATGDTGGLRYHASIPLRSKGKPLGIMNVAAAGHSVFTQPTLRLLGTIGHHVAVAVDRAGILAQERHRARQLEALSSVASSLMSVVQPAAILQLAVEQFVEKLGYESCGITVPAVHQGIDNGTRLAAAAHRLPTAKAEYSYDSDEEAPLLAVSDRILLAQSRSLMIQKIPHSEYEIRLESETVSAFHDVDRDLLSAFAWHLAAALENARLYQESLDNAKWMERRQLAADLHDAVSQRLFSALLLARTAGMLAEQTGADALSSTVAKVEALIADSQKEMRDLIHALRPADERGLIERLREHLAPLQLQSGTRIQWTSEGSAHIPLSFEQRETLLKVVSEAVQNTLKHAKARHAYVNVAYDGYRLLITVQDDGKGFDEQSIVKGLGTSTMYERMHRIGGALCIQSAPGKGTQVICSLPLAGESTDEANSQEEMSQRDRYE